MQSRTIGLMPFGNRFGGFLQLAKVTFWIAVAACSVFDHLDSVEK